MATGITICRSGGHRFWYDKDRRLSFAALSRNPTEETPIYIPGT